MAVPEVMPGPSRQASGPTRPRGRLSPNRMTILRPSKPSSGCITSSRHRAWTGYDHRELWSMPAVLAAGLHRPSRASTGDVLPVTSLATLRLTQERGDTAAAGLAEELGRVVKAGSVQHGGRPIKWLGDGVMLLFPDPGRGVDSALEMSVAWRARACRQPTSGCTPGPWTSRKATYYGQTVNSPPGSPSTPGRARCSSVEAEVDASRRGTTGRSSRSAPSNSRAWPGRSACTPPRGHAAWADGVMRSARTTAQRIADSLELLARNGDGWLATASPEGEPH